MFGSNGSVPGKFSYPRAVAIDNSGLVYVTDCGNDRVQLFSTNGQFISSFGSKGSQHGQLYHPLGICVDFTNTVYVTDCNHRVSGYTSSGQFIKCFGTKGRGEGELNGPEGVAVDNTTGTLYVCDTNNHRIVVYSFFVIFFPCLHEYKKFQLIYKETPHITVHVNRILYILYLKG